VPLEVLLTVSDVRDGSGSSFPRVISLVKAGAYEIAYSPAGYTDTNPLRVTTQEGDILLVVGIGGKPDYLIPKDYVFTGSGSTLEQRERLTLRS
jgi:hypothetical protein